MKPALSELPVIFIVAPSVAIGEQPQWPDRCCQYWWFLNADVGEEGLSTHWKDEKITGSWEWEQSILHDANFTQYKVCYHFPRSEQTKKTCKWPAAI